ncbi:lysylphosphatidylglycerol synthase domain-containing protein, partial [Micromonospora sagamiensis]
MTPDTRRGGDPAVGPAGKRWRRWLWRLLTVAFVLVFTAAVGRALVGQDWSVVGVLLRQQDRTWIGLLLAGALLAAMLGPLLAMLSWRAVLLELGPPVSLTAVVRVFFVGFFVKYVPGKVPGVVATVRVAAANGVTMTRTLVTGTLGMLLVNLTGLTVGLLTGPQVLGGRAVWLALAAAPLLVAMGWPDVLGRAARMALRLLRRPAPARSVSGRAVRVAVGWQTLSWLVSGVHLWLLAVVMGADAGAALPLCVGAFGLASAVGVLAVVVPDGLGVREAVLTGALALLLPVPSAVAVAVASR